MLSFLSGISINFERNAFKVEKSFSRRMQVCPILGAMSLPSIFNSNPKQWRKFTFWCGGGGGEAPQISNKSFTDFRPLEKAVFSPLLGQNSRKFGNLP
jgi:hypothetical protein